MSEDGLGRARLGPHETAILIPVRLASGRFPNKPLETLWGKPLFWWPYRAAVESWVADVVRVVTADSEVAEVCEQLGVLYFLQRSGDYSTGSDRIAAAIGIYPDSQVVVNLQCDEPQITPRDLQKLVQPLWESKLVQVMTLAHELSIDGHWAFDTNVVKVLTDQRSRALYFTRAAVPLSASCQAHVGVYGYRRSALESFARYPRGELEQSEDLEQLRLLEAGVPIDVIPVTGQRRSVNTREDLEWLESESSATT